MSSLLFGEGFCLWNHQVVLCASTNPAVGVARSALGAFTFSYKGRSGADHRPGMSGLNTIIPASPLRGYMVFFKAS